MLDDGLGAVNAPRLRAPDASPGHQYGSPDEAIVGLGSDKECPAYDTSTPIAPARVSEVMRTLRLSPSARRPFRTMT